MRLGIIGAGAIGRYVRDRALERGHEIVALVLPEDAHNKRRDASAGFPCVDTVTDLPDDIDHMIDCAGHAGLRAHGSAVLRSGLPLTTLSVGALADQQLARELESAANDGNSKLHLASGAIGALDCLRAARIGDVHSVTYVGRKPPGSWRGSPAETKLDLNSLRDAVVHFNGSARDAALEYPKNANVAAAVALAGVGFEKTTVRLVADPGLSENVHEIDARGEFGRFLFQIHGHSLPDNPRSSALAAMSVIDHLDRETQRIVF